MALQHFRILQDLDRDTLRHIIDRAIALKRGDVSTDLPTRKTLGLIFEKSSTRTRVAFEVAMAQLGGHAVFLANADTQLGRGEPVEDSARVLSRMVDCIAIRTFEHAKLELFAEHATVPIINALTDDFHPCQLLADVQTYIEHRGDISGRTVAWIGDGNNMCQSYINAAAIFNFNLRIACPTGFEPNADLVAQNAEWVSLGDDPTAAVADADLVVTDVWASMGQEHEQAQRGASFVNFQVDEKLMASAAPDALFMHCLPAHRGEEVTAEVLEGEQSVVWDEAENRLHSQKALLEYLLMAN